MASHICISLINKVKNVVLHISLNCQYECVLCKVDMDGRSMSCLDGSSLY
jgi:hypothetical protein